MTYKLALHCNLGLSKVLLSMCYSFVNITKRKRKEREREKKKQENYQVHARAHFFGQSKQLSRWHFSERNITNIVALPNEESVDQSSVWMKLFQSSLINALVTDE